MPQHNQPSTALTISMLIGGILGAIGSITLAIIADAKSFIGLGPAIGTTLGMSIGMMLEARQQESKER